MSIISEEKKAIRSEKEKQAIEIIKQEIDKEIETPKGVYITDIKMLLNLLENDKKEIEELRANLEKLEVSFALGVIDSNRKAEMLKNSVSKDKIREKIDKYRKKSEKLHSRELWNEPEDSIKDFKYNHYLEAYKELLEE